LILDVWVREFVSVQGLPLLHVLLDGKIALMEHNLNGYRVGRIDPLVNNGSLRILTDSLTELKN
jgi:hypothetical protein